MVMFSVAVSTLGLIILLWRLYRATEPKISWGEWAKRWAALGLDAGLTIGFFLGCTLVMTPTVAAPTAAIVGLGASWVIQKRVFSR